MPDRVGHNDPSRQHAEPWEDEYAAELVAEWRAKLPTRIALCPQHAEEFYYPLRDGEGLTCPMCSLEMVVYVRRGEADAANDQASLPASVSTDPEGSQRGQSVS